MLNADGTIGHVEVDLGGSVVMMFAEPSFQEAMAYVQESLASELSPDAPARR